MRRRERLAMHWIDVCNGDADGLCALHQLRLATPCPEAQLITGLKRDIALLDRIADRTDSHITVLDIGLAQNRQALLQLLTQGNQVFYADHHAGGDVPADPYLEAHIDPSPRTCTSLIIDRLLAGVHRPWAIVGAFGDNLVEVAADLALHHGIKPEAMVQLRELGTLLNYNGYGLTQEDLLVHPATLYQEMRQYLAPLDLLGQSPVLAAIRRGYAEDRARAADCPPTANFPGGRVFTLPAASWANRLVGDFANQVARERPELAHAVLLCRPEGGFLVSVRAPLATRCGADTLCRCFPTGGGRAAAAGINHLPQEQQEAFLAAFSCHFAAPQ